MNIYVVVEGVVEKKVYPEWISSLYPNLTTVDLITQVVKNNVFIVSGGGYPNYYEVIKNGILDVNNDQNFDRLVIAVDSELIPINEKINEIRLFLANFVCRTQVYIIVQHFCLETWALGNRTIIRRNPTNPKLSDFLHYFDVVHEDPELLPSNHFLSLNRVEFAYAYLRAIINDRYTGLSYTKHNPKVIMQKGYIDQIVNRYRETNHLRSFNSFLEAFTE
jgi:hypothetical protein